MSHKIEYQKVLNSSQLEAVMTLDGPILVIAGAGSGKTRTLVYRVARLVEMGVPPESILLLTFTRKAAGEMLERAARLADERCRNVSGGTFHSLAHRILRQNAPLIGFRSSFTVLDRTDMEEVIQSLVGEIEIDRGSIRFPKRSTLASILSKSANRQQSTESLMREEYAQFLEYVPHVNKLMDVYGEYKKTNQLMDYDDLILFFRQLLSENDEIRRHLSEQYRYIMVDEYQDTNAIQADIVKWLALSHRNIMVVGDDSQSIYSFRGANYRNMFDFPVLFPEAKVIKLEENYRSTQPILTFANALMDQAQEKYTKCLFTKRSDGEIPRAIDTRSEPEQAMFICRSIKDQINEGRSIKDFAILFRAAHHSFELEVELTREGIPYVKYGGFKFMESAHIKDVLAHLRVIMNRDDTVSWGRILRLVKNIGQGKSQSIINWLKANRSSPWQISEWPEAGKGDEGLKTLADLLGQTSAKGLAPQKAVEFVVKYYDPILKEKFDDFPRRQKDLEQLIPMADRYKKLRAFLDDLVLEPPTSPADINPRERGDSLILSTVHSAKGLEWSVVFVIWVMEGYFPSAKAYSNREAIEEERRLMYVAATRAKDQLIICYPSEEARPAWQWGEVGYRSGLSCFLQALPDDVMEYGSSMPSGRRPRIQWPMGEARIYQDDKGHPSQLRPGDRVNHPAFGQGVISKFMDDEKVEVLFRDWGPKLLHLGYTTLEKM
ncbi:MAG: UvrD-helicase domain-containing protein [Deltaproteobacteria bacterium]|nr:MAG: UvrD-helicase domain-containing protein [Deltaproteobacteria bacterium]